MQRVFLCDDTNEYRALVRTVLDAEDDIQVVGEACSGQQCLDEVPAARPDLVLLDLNMPGMHGLEALPRLREAAPDVAVAILTTDSEADSECRARRLGAVAFIRKPQDVFELPGAVRDSIPALNRRQDPRDL